MIISQKLLIALQAQRILRRIIQGIKICRKVSNIMKMKRIKCTLLLVLAIFAAKVYGDIITYKSPSAKVCVRIENLKDYPDIVVVGVSDCLTVFSKPKVDIIDLNTCIEVHKACPLKFYAVKKEYLKKKRVSKINWEKDENVRKANITVDAKQNDWSFYHSNVMIFELSFSIEGFNKNSMMMFRIKTTEKFGNGKPDHVNWMPKLPLPNPYEQNF